MRKNIKRLNRPLYSTHLKSARIGLFFCLVLIVDIAIAVEQSGRKQALIGADPASATLSNAAVNRPSLSPLIEGLAFDASTGALLYSETHYCQAAYPRCLVQYRNESDELILEKYLDTSKSQMAPDCVQIDYRSKQLIMSISDRAQAGFYGLENTSSLTLDHSRIFTESEIASIDDIPNVFVDDDFRSSVNKESLREIARFDRPDNLVIDAGFDAWVRLSWEKLLKDGRDYFNFAVPSRGQAVMMKVTAKGSSYCQADVSLEYKAVNPTSNIQCFNLTTKSWLFSVFFKSITLAYDVDTKKLLSFKGLSDIKSGDGKPQLTLIQYNYST